MPIDPVDYAQIAEINVKVLRPFLHGTENLHEDAVVDEIFVLKPLVDAVGDEEAEKICTKLANEGRHDDIIPRLREREEELKNAAPSKDGGILKWLFRGKEKKSKKDLKTSPPTVDKEHHKHHILQKRESPNNADNIHNVESTSAPMDNASFPAAPTTLPTLKSIETEVPSIAKKHHSHSHPPLLNPVSELLHRSGPIDTVVAQQEKEMSQQYNFFSGQAPPPEVSTRSAHHREDGTNDDFAAIFSQFLNTS